MNLVPGKQFWIARKCYAALELLVVASFREASLRPRTRLINLVSRAITSLFNS